MAADLNHVDLIGRLTRDADERGGGSVHAFRLAFSDRRKVGDNWEDGSNFINVVSFRGEHIAQYLTKGKQVGVSGRLRMNEWEDKDGNRRSDIEVIADDIQLLGGGGNEGGAGGDLPASEPAKPAGDDRVPF